MKRSTFLLAFFIVVISTNIQSSLAGLYTRGSSSSLISYLSTNETNKTDIKDGDNSNSNYFQLLAFGSFLDQYNFSTIWFNHSGRINTGTGVTYNKCEKNPSAEEHPTSLYCTLVTAGVNRNNSSSETIHLYLNESNHYNLQSDNSTLTFFDVPAKILLLNNSETEINKTCQVNVSYEFVNAETQNPYDYTYDKLSDLSVKISVLRGECDFEFHTSALKPNTGGVQMSKIYPYILMMVGIGLIQALACGMLVKTIDRNANMAKRTALGSMCMLITFDFFIYLLHFTYWTSISKWMAAVFIYFFILSVFLEPAVLYYVFSTLQTRTNASILTLLYQLYFWLMVCGASLVISQTYMPNCMFYVFPFFLVPQIVDNFLSGTKYRWNLWLILGLGLPKLVYIVYLSLNLVSLFHTDFSPSTIVYCVGIILFEFIILQIQTKFPTFGLKLFPSNQYSYDCTQKEYESLAEGVVCSICTENVKETPLNGNQVNQQQPLMQQDCGHEDVMKTPCEHYYHSYCLKEWFRKKFECPNCRQKLPPLINADD